MVLKRDVKKLHWMGCVCGEENKNRTKKEKEKQPQNSECDNNNQQKKRNTKTPQQKRVLLFVLYSFVTFLGKPK